MFDLEIKFGFTTIKKLSSGLIFLTYHLDREKESNTSTNASNAWNVNFNNSGNVNNNNKNNTNYVRCVR